MNGRRWDDDRWLVTDLHTALSPGGLSSELLRQQALSAFDIGRTHSQAILAELVFDSACDPEPAGPIRAVGSARLLAFRTDRLAIDIEVTESGLVGQVYTIDGTDPAAPDEPLLEVVGETPQGVFGHSPLAELGGFELPLPAPGPVRLRAILAEGTMVTSWLVLRYPR
ncbi:hypothetical protein DDE19_12200 [Micromonospora ureilytica]|uniref:Uncharacterized protein n=1 Tax=Micromonospora ureilytica TaxID=709868 RepID=A0A3N9XW46_9ACTN|nr:hypothetical protein [Micromonospora ureilytica]MBG6065016.1 hypothetical protein [Micromonospora ureilytica]RQX17104.1 hypothetical protein DDE19_12200 [Micromonospora ureilytica]